MSVSEISELARNFNWHSPSWDLFILLFWAVASVIYAFTAGRGRIISILISLYMAKLLVVEAPFLSSALTSKLNVSVVSLQQLITFIVIFLILFLFLSKYAFRTSVDGRHMASSIIFGIIFSFLQIGLLINVVLTFLPPPLQDGLSPLIRTFFINQPAGFVWLVAPLLFLIVAGKHISHDNEL